MKRFPVLVALFCLTAASAADRPEFVLEILGYRQFSPQQIKVPAGVKFVIAVQNHSDEAEEFESYPLNREKHVEARTDAKIFLGPLDPGRYVFEIENPKKKGDPALGVIVAE